MKNVIDISKYQGAVDFGRAKASGKVDGVMIRAVSTNSGGIYIDPYMERSYAECKRLGIPCGAYYYTYAQTPAQADAELDMLRKALAGKVFEYPIAVDVEDNLLRPLSAAALTDLVIRAVKAIEGWGCYAMVYTYANYRQTELDMSRLAAYDLWIADYRGARPGMAHGMWQYSSRGRVPGVTGYVDLNYAYKEYPAIISAAGLNDLTGMGATPAPAPLYTATVGPVSGGDLARVQALAKELAVPCAAQEV